MAMQKKLAVDLSIADYPDGLRVPGVSDPPSQIPPWNANIPRLLNILMAFALTYLHTISKRCFLDVKENGCARSL